MRSVSTAGRLGWLQGWVVLALAGLAAAVIAWCHPAGNRIISFDEGFHGGSALFVTLFVLHHLGVGVPVSPSGILHEYLNGIIWYPPLWVATAGFLGLVFGHTTAVFRAASSLFYVATLWFTYWLVRKEGGFRTGLWAALILGSMPIVVVYSNLMMLEEPVLLGVTAMVGLFYLWAMELLPRSRWTFAGVTAAFILLPLTKLATIGAAFGAMGLFAVLSSLCYWRQGFYRRFLRWEFALWPALSVLSLWAYILLERHYLHVDLLSFHLEQTADLAGHEQRHSAVGTALAVMWEHRWFYLRDFRHMPYLGWIWFGSVGALALWKRTPLTLLLACWTAACYAFFSGVEPQAPQYVIPIYAPLAIATALLLHELLRRLPVRQEAALGTVAVLALVGGQLLALPRSESFGWFRRDSGEPELARALAEAAKPGDRVLTWHDGMTYAIRQAALGKGLQIHNDVLPTCSTSMNDSFEWAAVSADAPSPSASDERVLGQAPWRLVGRFGEGGRELLYHNDATVWPMRLSAAELGAKPGEDILRGFGGDKNAPTFWGCPRLLPLGRREVIFTMKALQLPAQLPDDQSVVRVELSPADRSEMGGREITAKELRQSADYQQFSFAFDQAIPDKLAEFRVFIFAPGVQIALHQVEVR